MAVEKRAGGSMIFEIGFEHSEALFEAALAAFIAQGYSKTSLSTILEQAGMSKGQFYYYFRGKEDLYFALIDALIAKKAAFLASVMQPGDFQQDIFSIFKTQMRHSLAFAQAYPVINQFAESFLREKGRPIYQKALAAHNFENNEAIMGLVRRAYANGEFREDLPLEFVQKLFAYMFTHMADLAGLHTVDSFGAGVDYVIDFLKSGLAKQPPQPPAG